MEDKRIIALYWARNEEAIAATSTKYGRYCYTIAWNVLHSSADSEECVNDTWLSTWNSIPPHRPEIFSAFLGKITRRLSIDRWREKTAAKRGGSQMESALEELSYCVPSADRTEEEFEARELQRLIDRFIRVLPDMERRVFLRRYWYLDSIADIARRFGFSESKVKSMLHRTRTKLKTELEKEGA